VDASQIELDGFVMAGLTRRCPQGPGGCNLVRPVTVLAVDPRCPVDTLGHDACLFDMALLALDRGELLGMGNLGDAGVACRTL